MQSVVLAIALLALLIWAYLLFFRGGFWRCAERLDSSIPPPTPWPDVTAIIPARDEAAVIAESLTLRC